MISQSTWQPALRDHSRSIPALAENGGRPAAPQGQALRTEQGKTPPLKIRRARNDYGRAWEGFF